MELAFKTLTSIDIMAWVAGISILKALSQTPLKRGNEKQGAGVNSSEHGAEGGMDSGGNSTKGDVRRRLVCAEDINTLYEGRFNRRAALLEKQKRDNADRIARNSVSTCSRALRESRHDRAYKEAS